MILSNTIPPGHLQTAVALTVNATAFIVLSLFIYPILRNAPRVGNPATHDLINRIVGASTRLSETTFWLYRRRQNASPTTSTSLGIIFLLYILHATFIPVSSLSILGVHQCTVPGPNVMARPASVNSEADAERLVRLNIIDGIDPSSLNAHRCDSSTPTRIGAIRFSNCTSWRNSTYADGSAFTGLEPTDSDALMPRYLAHSNISQTLDLTSHFLGPGPQRVTTTTLQNGILVDPRETGLVTLFGVPNLVPQSKVFIPKTMAVELEIGCMTTGLYNMDSLNLTFTSELFQTGPNWRLYTGPDYMYDTLKDSTDRIRNLVQPFFDTSTLDSAGFLHGDSLSPHRSSAAAHVQTWSARCRVNPDGTVNDDDTTNEINFIKNCTASMHRKLNVTEPYLLKLSKMCSFLGLSGPIFDDVNDFSGLSKMICSAATQVNLVSAEVAMGEDGSLSLEMTRLPSTLNYLQADYWDDDSPFQNITEYLSFHYLDPLERFRLAPEHSAPKSHYIANRYYLNMWSLLANQTSSVNIDVFGPGSAGNVITALGQIVLTVFDFLAGRTEFQSLGVLTQGYERYNPTPDIMTKTLGQIGASYVLSSLGYNGWAALNSTPVEIVSTGGGGRATCYEPLYAIAFLPLLLSTLVALIWGLVGVFDSSRVPVKVLETAYGGVKPYLREMDIFAVEKPNLVWEGRPKLHLQAVSAGGQGERRGDEDNDTASRYLRKRNMLVAESKEGVSLLHHE